MPSWEKQKESYLQIKANLDGEYSDTKVETAVTQMNSAISRYIKRGGIKQSSGSEDVDYKEATDKFKWLQDGQKTYIRSVKELSQVVAGVTDDADIQMKLRQIGQLKDDIVNLEKTLQNTKQDVNTSQSRQESVEKAREQVSPYQGFSRYIGFTKPIRTTSVPFLIGFGLLLLFFSGLLMKEFFGVGEAVNSMNMGESSLAFLQDSRFYSALSGVVFVSVVLGVLAYSGYLGKTV
jgi:hypothetical protein